MPRLMRLFGALLALVLLAAGVQAATGGQGSDNRLALVIGNAAYDRNPLENPINDARAMAEALGKLGFKVRKLENASLRQMDEAVRAFGDDLAQGGAGLFFYAGHGMQVKGSNYLIPIGELPKDEDDVPYKAFNADMLLDRMETAGNPINIVILDACRDNPFVKRKSRSTAGGLAQMNAGKGTLIAFATAPGKTASDGSGNNGLFTEHFLRTVKQPGLKVEDVFKRVRAGVEKESGGAQIPWENTSLTGDFYFIPPAPGQQAAMQTTDEATIELEYWNSVKASSDPADLAAYLKKYPKGRFADLADNRLRSLGGGGKAATPAATTQPATQVASYQPAKPATAAWTTGKTFSFSAPDDDDQEKADRIAAMKSTPCRDSLRNKRILLTFSRKGTDGIQVAQGYAATYAGIQKRLQGLGLKVVREGSADFILRGLIEARSGVNPLLKVNEVRVKIGFSLARPNGSLVTTVSAAGQSYAGSDLESVAADLVEEQADEVVAKIYKEYCSQI